MISISLLKDSSESFLTALANESIPYNIRKLGYGTVVASGILIDIAQTAITSSAIAAVLVTWLKVRTSRKVIITTNEMQVIHIEGYSVAEVEKLLKVAKNISVFDTDSKSSEPNG